jgi:hypothetical protein
MRYYAFWQDTVWSVHPEWIQQFQDSIPVAYIPIDKYTPRNWRIYNEGKVIGYTDGYNQILLEGHDHGWDKGKDDYQKILERGLREAKQLWKEAGANQCSEEITAE